MLYANLGTQDQAQITQALDAAQIPYRMAAGLEHDRSARRAS